LELRHLRAFVAIAEHRHYGRAAASIKVTQPAITQRIQVLEAELGVRLLERNAREVRLTPAGETLIEHARGLVQIEERALAALRDHAAGIVGRLSISYLTLWDVGLPAEILAEYRRRYPAIKLDMTSGYSQTNVERLLAGDVDFAFVGVSIGEHKGIAIRPLDRHDGNGDGWRPPAGRGPGRAGGGDGVSPSRQLPGDRHLACHGDARYGQP